MIVDFDHKGNAEDVPHTVAFTHVTSILSHNRPSLKDVHLLVDNVQIPPEEPPDFEDVRVIANQMENQFSVEQLQVANIFLVTGTSEKISKPPVLICFMLVDNVVVKRPSSTNIFISCCCLKRLLCMYSLD